MSTLLSILHSVGVIFLALMILNVMILVHEWGHFLAARWRGLKVEKFQIWFGHPIWKKTWNGVQYGLGWIPAGGFVALPQMAPMDAIEGKGAEKSDPLPAITPLDKIIVALAGPVFSFALACLFALIVWQVGRPINEPANPTQIGYVSPDGAAAHSGLQAGDIIRKIDGKPVIRWNGQVSSVLWGIVSSENEQIVFTVERDGKMLDFSVKPRLENIGSDKPAPTTVIGKALNFVFGRPPLPRVGIAGQTTLRIAEVLPHSPAAEAGLKPGDVLATVNGQPARTALAFFDQVKAAQEAPVAITVTRDGQSVALEIKPRRPDKPSDARFPEAGAAFGDPDQPWPRVYPTPRQQIMESLQGMGNLLSAIASRSQISVTHMGGPVTIVRTYTAILQNPEAWRLVLWFSVFLNVNLAVMNMLPFPVLDGGHITMAIVEWIRRRPINVKVLEYIQTACVLLVLGFFITITLKDIGDTGGQGGEVKFLPREEAKAPGK